MYDYYEHTLMQIYLCSSHGLPRRLDAEMKLEANDICVQSREMLHHDANQLRVHVLAQGYQLMHSVKVLLKTVSTTQGRT